MELSTRLRFVALIGASILVAGSAFADNSPQRPSSAPEAKVTSQAGPSATPAPTPTDHWNVRIEALMVDMSQDKALALLPDLRDPAKIDGAVTQILAAIDHKEAILTGFPLVQTLDGERGDSEAIQEQRYPTDFEPPSEPGVFGRPKPSPSPSLHNVAVPTAFETRSVGATLDVEPHVLQNGDWIRLSNIISRRVIFLGFDTLAANVTSPRFVNLSTSTSITLRNGQRRLIAVHKLPHVENQIELVILQAWAEPIK